MDHSLSIACGGGVRRVFLGEGGSGFGFQGEWKGYQSSPRKYKWGGGGGKGGLRVGLEGFWIWFLVGTAGRGTSCRQGTLKEGL